MMMEEANLRQSRHTGRQSQENCRERDKALINRKATLQQNFSVILGAYKSPSLFVQFELHFLLFASTNLQMSRDFFQA